MKKILSILICVVLGVSSAWAQDDCTPPTEANGNTYKNAQFGLSVGVGLNTPNLGTAYVSQIENTWQTSDISTTGAVVYHYDYQDRYTSGSNWNKKYYNYANQTFGFRVVPNDGYYFDSWTFSGADGSMATVAKSPYQSGNTNNEHRIDFKLFKTHDATWSSDPSLYPCNKPTMMANLYPIVVTGVNAVNDIEVSDLATPYKGSVVFNVTNSSNVDKNDFDYNVEGENFSILVDECSYSGGKFTVVVQYIAQNIDNVNEGLKPEIKANVTITSKGGEVGAENKTQTATIRANVSLVPVFEVNPTSYDFYDEWGIIANGATQTKNIDITSTNNVAKASEWSFILSDAKADDATTFSGSNNPYSIDDTNPLQPIVKFTAPATGYYENVTCTLSISSTYTDAQSKQIKSAIKYVVLSADAGGSIKINHTQSVTHNFGTVTYGTRATVTMPFIATVAYDGTWNPASIFTHSITANQITVNVPSSTAPGNYTSELQFVYDGGVATLSAVANVRLAKPELQANGDKKCVLLEWNKIDGASQYIIKSGANVLATLTAADAQTAGYEYTVTSIAGTPVVIGQSYPFTITAVYGNDASIAEKISVSDEKTAIPTAYLSTIKIGNADKNTLGIAPGLKTGLTVGGDDGNYNPSKAQWDVDVTSAFDNAGNALFDRLYIFGLTTGPGGGNVQGYAASGVTMPDAITPCYIYEKRSSDGKAYEHRATIDNMNTADKNHEWFDIALSGSQKMKIYLTGWCPYGSAGDDPNEHGLLYVKGNNNNQIDIYMEDCYLYAKVHKGNDGKTWSESVMKPKEQRGSGFDAISVGFALLGGSGWAAEGAYGASSAIVIESSSSSAFPANIHIKGNNLVFSHLGAPLKVDISVSSLSVEIHSCMGHYSAPIFVRPQDANSKATLTMDDKWPISASDAAQYTHTNGYLKFDKFYPAAPSIDLGNKNTILNFNGGRFELAANLPRQTNYMNNLAICVRDGNFKAEGLPGYVYNGLAGDATSGTVNINDGSVYVTRFPAEIKTWAGADVDNSDYFEDIITIDEVEYSQTLRLPANAYVRGGSHKGYIRAVTDINSSGESPTDGYSALEQRVYEVNDDDIENGFVKEAYFTNTNPLGLYRRERVTPSTGTTEMLLETYYANNTSYYSSVGGSYGRAAISPEEEGGEKKIYLWVPGKAKHPVSFTNWFQSMSYTKANPAGDLGGLMDDLVIEFGGDNAVPYETYSDGANKHVVKNLWRVEMDDNLLQAANTQGKLPAKVGNEYMFVDLDESSFPNDALYANITNTGDYVIKNSLYSFRTIKADDWMLFCPQFDVKNIYILEACDEAYLKNLSDVIPIANGGGRENALLAQAKLNLDMTALVGIDLSATTDDRSLWDYYSKYSAYVNYVRNYAGEDSDIAFRKPFYAGYDPALNSIRTELQHLVKKGDGSFNYDEAHYYLYQTDATDWWIDPETDILKINWQLAPASTKAADGTTDVVMKKGQVYAMQFPYCPGCNDGTKWDYWTGKMIVFEGEGPQTLSGSDEHDIIKATEAGGFHGNYTFKDISVESGEMESAYFNTAGYMFDKEISGTTSLPAGESFVILPTSVHSSMPGKRIKSINAKTGAITWEEGGDNQNTITGTPTIAGNRQMMVYTIDGGVGIIPVSAQQVSIYNAAGQLITSQYLTDEVQISLPTGIYLVSGEKDQAKVIVK